MVFGYRSSRSSRNFRSSRGGRGSFRGRGRGSDSYYNPNRKPYSDRGSYRPYRSSGYRGSNYRSKEGSYDSRGSGSSRYHSDRYSHSRGRREENLNYHHREIRESASGSFSREHSRRSDEEPERKRIRSEIAISFKGASPRRSYDDLEISGRSFKSSSNSPYRSESNPFGKSYRSKEFSDFKKPLPPERSFGRRSIRGSRGRGSTRPVTSRIIKSSTSFLKRGGVGRINTRLKTSKLQLLLRRKKQLRILRLRKERETRIRMLASPNNKLDEDNIPSSEDEIDDMEAEEEIEEAIEKEIEKEIAIEQEIEEKKEIKVKDEPMDSADEKEEKIIVKKTKPKTSHDSPDEVQKSITLSKIVKIEQKERISPVRGLRRDHITLKCIHCKTEYDTFKKYQIHLPSYKHKKAMESVLHELKQKLRRMRTEQREQQRIIDEESNDFARTSYCKLCKLNFKQTKHEHFTSNFHISMNEFLNPRCKVCRISFGTPILYEHHRCTLNHIKRKAFLAKKGINYRDEESDDENNDDDNFMVLDSVGSADESAEEVEEEEEEEELKPVENEDNVTNEKKSPLTGKKRKIPRIIGSEFIKRVAVYYCKLCRLCLTYHPERNQEELLLTHGRSRFHLKRCALEKRKKQSDDKTSKSNNNQKIVKSVNEKTDLDDNEEAQLREKFWLNDEDEDDDHKSSEDEEDSQIGNRYDRFGHSDEKDNVEKPKSNESGITDEKTTQDTTKS